MSSILRHIHRATIAVVALVIWSCGSTGPTGDAIVEVAAVVINPPASTLSLNSTLPLQAQVQDAAGGVISNVPVLWTVKDPNVATVSETGVVTGKSLGVTQVAASSGGKSGIATVTVQKTPVATVSVSPNRVDAVVGSRTPLTGRASDADGNVLSDRAIAWTSSNTALATVDGTGVVVAVASGAVTITGASEGKSATSVFTIVQGTIASVTVTPNPVSMVAGQTAQLAASARDAGGAVVTGRPVIWSSSKNDVATVSADGVVKGVAAGTTSIIATVDGVSGSSTVTVTNAPVKSVSVAPQAPTVAIGSTTQLTPTVIDANDVVVTGRPVTWASSNTAIATVSGVGLVTGVGVGTAIITATSEGRSGTTTVTVSLVPVRSVTLAPTTLSLTPLQTGTLVPTVTLANGTVVTDRLVAFTSSDPLIASVTQAGVVTALLPGTSTITASSGGQSATSVVTVGLVPVATVTVAPATVSLTPLQTRTLVATVTDANGTVVTNRPVSWSSSNALVATVTQAGVVTALIVGSTTITATSESKSGTATVTVGPVPVGSVTVTPSTATLAAGAGTTLTATVKDANGNVMQGAQVAWSTSNSQVAAVSSSGAVTTSLAGTATITATSGGQSGTATITVNPGAVTSVSVTPKTGSVRVGVTGQLTATAKDSKGNVVTGRTFVWTSSNNTNATVAAGNPSSIGLVTGKKAGTATITVTADGQADTAAITVVN
ncbi:MAG: Ig-like domain-containing protein [Gemmatimonadaceae bacterium]